MDSNTVTLRAIHRSGLEHVITVEVENEDQSLLLKMGDKHRHVNFGTLSRLINMESCDFFDVVDMIDEKLPRINA